MGLSDSGEFVFRRQRDVRAAHTTKGKKGKFSRNCLECERERRQRKGAAIVKLPGERTGEVRTDPEAPLEGTLAKAPPARGISKEGRWEELKDGERAIVIDGYLSRESRDAGWEEVVEQRGQQVLASTAVGSAAWLSRYIPDSDLPEPLLRARQAEDIPSYNKFQTGPSGQRLKGARSYGKDRTTFRYLPPPQWGPVQVGEYIASRDEVYLPWMATQAKKKKSGRGHLRQLMVKRARERDLSWPALLYWAERRPLARIEEELFGSVGTVDCAAALCDSIAQLHIAVKEAEESVARGGDNNYLGVLTAPAKIAFRRKSDTGAVGGSSRGGISQDTAVDADGSFEDDASPVGDVDGGSSSESSGSSISAWSSSSSEEGGGQEAVSDDDAIYVETDNSYNPHKTESRSLARVFGGPDGTCPHGNYHPRGFSRKKRGWGGKAHVNAGRKRREVKSAIAHGRLRGAESFATGKEFS